MDDCWTRRRALAAATTVGGGAVAGCLGGGNGGGGNGEDSGGDGGDDDGNGDDGGGTADSDGGDGDGDNGSESDGGDGDGDGGSDDLPSWQTATLEDVTTGESFTIAGLERPAFVHTFAIWCSTCQRQHGEFEALFEQESAAFDVVELNIDPDESPDAVREHASEHGFDWTFAISPPDVTEALVSAYGSRMASPPQSAVLLVCPDGATHVLDEDAVMSASQLETALGEQC
jgi:thiol-disulfide isomerase/thioredoxin